MRIDEPYLPGAALVLSDDSPGERRADVPHIPLENELEGLTIEVGREGLSQSLLDLSRQQRNLLLLRPLFQLELNKFRIGDGDQALFTGIDTHYLALSALDFMMVATPK